MLRKKNVRLIDHDFMILMIATVGEWLVIIKSVQGVANHQSSCPGMCKSLQNWKKIYFTEQKSTQPNKVYSTKQSLLNEWMFTQLTKCLKNWAKFTQTNKSLLNWKKVRLGYTTEQSLLN